MKKNAQNKELKKLKKEKKELEKSLNPFNKNFSLNTKEKILDFLHN